MDFHFRQNNQIVTSFIAFDLDEKQYRRLNMGTAGKYFETETVYSSLNRWLYRIRRRRVVTDLIPISKAVTKLRKLAQLIMFRQPVFKFLVEGGVSKQNSGSIVLTRKCQE